MRKLLIASTNEGKVTEFKIMLKDLPFEIISLSDLDSFEEVDETADTFEGNAVLKAEGYAKQTGILTLADDSGLVIDSLDGAPGVFSKRFGETTEERNQKVLDLMNDIPYEDRSARFIAVISIHDPKSGETENFEGKVEGFITEELIGEEGFGYDPVFYSTELKKTFAQATGSEKNEVSHRGRAMVKAKKYLQ